MKKPTTKKKTKTLTKTSSTSAKRSVYVKVHSREYLGYNPRIVIAICDVNLMGSIYANTKTGAMLNLKDNQSFYLGEKSTPEEARSVIAKYANYERASFNITGEISLKLASEFFNISKAKKIGKTKHLEIYRL